VGVSALLELVMLSAMWHHLRRYRYTHNNGPNACYTTQHTPVMLLSLQDSDGATGRHLAPTASASGEEQSTLAHHRIPWYVHVYSSQPQITATWLRWLCLLLPSSGLGSHLLAGDL
jgi:hypothetical protein